MAEVWIQPKRPLPGSGPGAAGRGGTGERSDHPWRHAGSAGAPEVGPGMHLPSCAPSLANPKLSVSVPGRRLPLLSSSPASRPPPSPHLLSSSADQSADIDRRILQETKAEQHIHKLFSVLENRESLQYLNR